LNYPNTCIVIVGPTAAGKTSLAIQVAKFLQTQIISADSRQCYRELNIGTGKPSVKQLEEVKHHFINTHSISEAVNAASFEKYALEAAAGIFRSSRYVVLAGGTGLYVNAFCDGMDEVPVIVPGVRNNITECYATYGLEWLQNEVKNADPEFYSAGEMFNPQRMMRALEVVRSTGRSIRSFHTKEKRAREFEIIKVGLELPKAVLYQQINSRVDEMLEQGLVDEVRGLLPYKHLNALNTVGYKELFACFDQVDVSINAAIELIKKNTRHYAKRQMTWFKKDPSVHWIHPGDFNAIVELLGK
jgi:tRNA dimethylallyltransferase